MARGILGNRLSGLSSATDTGSVALEFCGVFRSGPREGELFGGTIRYHSGRAATERHAGFAVFDEWEHPIMTAMVAGRMMTADCASVYAAIPDGGGKAMDLVTFTGGSEAVGAAETVEMMFASTATGDIDARHMPAAGQLQSMVVKRIYYSAPGEAPSSGDIYFGPSN